MVKVDNVTSEKHQFGRTFSQDFLTGPRRCLPRLLHVACLCPSGLFLVHLHWLCVCSTQEQGIKSTLIDEKILNSSRWWRRCQSSNCIKTDVCVLCTLYFRPKYFCVNVTFSHKTCSLIYKKINIKFFSCRQTSIRWASTNLVRWPGDEWIFAISPHLQCPRLIANGSISWQGPHFSPTPSVMSDPSSLSGASLLAQECILS